MSVLIQTSIGNIVIDLEVSKARKESLNFIKLCKTKYFNFAPFYNVQNDFIVESGAPLYPLSKEGQCVWSLSKNSTHNREFLTEPNQLNPNKKGAVSYLTTQIGNGKHASSLFAITLADIDPNVKSLSNNVVFGNIVEGIDILDKLNDVIVDKNYRPLQDVRIHHTYILHDPFEDVEGLEIPVNSPEISKDQISTIRLNDIEEINLDEDVDETEFKRKQASEAESKALTLELIGDLPSAKVKPMENVLFICKLNPITRDDDLKTIFSRFGKIISCEVIRDSKTNDSLQYAFIEFEEKKSCENAYFKMNDVLIDDRRIHVDFSQSVSKLSETWRQQVNHKREARGDTNINKILKPFKSNNNFRRNNNFRNNDNNVKRLKWSKK